MKKDKKLAANLSARELRSLANQKDILTMNKITMQGFLKHNTYKVNFSVDLPYCEGVFYTEKQAQEMLAGLFTLFLPKGTKFIRYGDGSWNLESSKNKTNRGFGFDSKWADENLENITEVKSK